MDLVIRAAVVFGFIFRRNESAREGSVVVEALPVLNRTHPGWTDERFSAFMREERAFEFEYEPDR